MRAYLSFKGGTRFLERKLRKELFYTDRRTVSFKFRLQCQRSIGVKEYFVQPSAKKCVSPKALSKLLHLLFYVIYKI